MPAATYRERRGQLEAYFDRTAVGTWAALTSDRPVGRIRATVRAGRDRMRERLLSYLPEDLTGQRVLDAGCGTGALAACAARRGADVVAVDISRSLVELAEERTAGEVFPGTITFRVGDMGDPALGRFDWVVAMDSLIHYPLDQVIELVGVLGARASQGLSFTFAPSTPLLQVMHTVGKAFPRGHRAPDIVPVSESLLRARLAAEEAGHGMTLGRSERIEAGFYTSQTMELVRP